jgi:D-glycero-alpha-D-manno-heptose-7-phosphate kinase
MASQAFPHTIINAFAPIRICDNGGWTDTWFAEYGSIFNIAVYPYAEVQVAVSDASGVDDRIVINAENYGERYAHDPTRYSSLQGWNRHPLLEAAIEYMQVPENYAFEITIFSEAPAGASTGTSAAISVALIGALDVLTPGRMAPHEVALAAQQVETILLKQQCGIQDQLCSAYGGINYIEMTQYPLASVSLVLVYLGKTHSSSQIHEMVIQSLEDLGPDSPLLDDLRKTASRSRDALYAGDFVAFGQAMIENTAAQRRLHPQLISTDAQKVIDIARAYEALGWKVNGAGGEGGSLTILCGPVSDRKRTMIRSIQEENKRYIHIPTYLSRYGLRVWSQPVEQAGKA